MGAFAPYWEGTRHWVRGGELRVLRGRLKGFRRGCGSMVADYDVGEGGLIDRTGGWGTEFGGARG